MADLYLIALSKKRGDECRSNSLHYLLSKEATRCLPCGEVICGTLHHETEKLAESVYYLTQLYRLGELGIIHHVRNILKERYEEASKEPYGPYKASYKEHTEIDDEKLNEYQGLVNEMDLRCNPFARFTSFVKTHRTRKSKSH